LVHAQFPRSAASSYARRGTSEPPRRPLPIASSNANASTQANNTVGSIAAARLDKKEFHDVKVSVDNGTATLTGTVDLYGYKADAEKRVHKAKGVTAVRNLIEVAGPTIPDEVLKTNSGEVGI